MDSNEHISVTGDDVGKVEMKFVSWCSDSRDTVFGELGKGTAE